MGNFNYKYSKDNAGRQIVGSADAGMKTIIDNSAVVQVGDPIKIDTSGNALRATAGDSFAGILVGVKDVNGVFVTPDSATLDTWTVASDNETVAKRYAVIDISMSSVYSGAQDGTVNTTNKSGEFGAYIDIESTNQTLDESTATRTAGTGGQFSTHGTDPDDTTRILVSINESQLYPDHA